MGRYKFQLRRGWKDDETGRDDWATYEEQEGHEKPLEGELVLEYDNGVPRLKIGDGIREFSDLPYMSVDSFILATPTTITLKGGDAWVCVGENRYVQYVTEQLKGKVTANSKVDLQPTVEQLSMFAQKDVTFNTENEGGDIRVCAVGIRPENTYANIQVMITEVGTDE